MNLRPRTPYEWKRLRNRLISRFNRFFPDGPSALITHEFNARVESGRFKLNPNSTSTTRRAFRPGYYPQLMSGAWIKLGADRSGMKGPKINLDNWKLHDCHLCRKRYWIARSSSNVFCSHRCSALATLHADVLCHPDRVYPLTFNLRYWLLTHPHPGRQPAHLARKFLPSEVHLLTSPNLRKFLDETIHMSDQQVEALRKRYADLLEKHATDIGKIIAGKKDITHGQTRVLLAVMDKVIPAAATPKAPKAPIPLDLTPEDVSSMSRTELEQYLANEKQRLIEVSPNKDTDS